MQVGAVMVLGTIISILIVDGHIFRTVGRRALLVAGGVVMLFSEVLLPPYTTVSSCWHAHEHLLNSD